MATMIARTLCFAPSKNYDSTLLSIAIFGQTLWLHSTTYDIKQNTTICPIKKLRAVALLLHTNMGNFRQSVENIQDQISLVILLHCVVTSPYTDLCSMAEKTLLTVASTRGPGYSTIIQGSGAQDMLWC